MIPVIMSGGSGSRLWPVSRQSFPKQFCDLLDESLYSKTLKRLLSLGSPWTITVEPLRVLTDRCNKELKIPLSQVIYEPFGRNTAPAIALLCQILKQNNQENEIVGIFPADHLIEDEEQFLAAVRRGEAFAKQGHIVTLGVKPSYAATGYGYIETEGVHGDSLKAIAFHEKPNLEKAKSFIENGRYFWNAGMFIFKASTMLELLQKNAPDICEVLSTLKKDLSNLKELYEKVRTVSIDYAVMEKLPSHICIPCPFVWNDIGSWDALSEVLIKTPNKVTATTVDLGKNNFVFSQTEKIYGFVGVEDLIVVDTSDATLIAKKGESEKVKELVDRLKKDKIIAADQHTFEVRPWGRFEVLKDTADFKSKTIVVDAGAQLSLQSHAKRAEHWIVVKGQGEVILDDKIIPVSAGQHIFIPVGSKHRMRNNSTEPLEFVEVQLGSYFGEDDIVRYQDDYNRH